MGNSHTADGAAAIHRFYSSASWIEGKAEQQLAIAARLDGVKAIAAMPDLHPGKYGPVGCAILSSHIHPELVGSDIGCGMGLFRLDLAVRKLRLDKAAERLRALEGPFGGDARSLLADAGLSSTGYDGALGTIGGGNHFCELQAIEEIVLPEAAARLGLERDAAALLVHSGSRGLGFSVLEEHVRAGLRPLEQGSPAASAYLTAHDGAVRWAALNRAVIAGRAAEVLRSELQPVVDLSHNLVELTADGCLHRKGAAPSDRGAVPVPGSRATLSYLVEPMAMDGPDALASIAHGAGRKYDRISMHGRAGRTRSDLQGLARNPFGGHVVCEDKGLLVEEAGEAYKSIDRVIADLQSFGLARVVATFRPLVTFKTAREEPRDRKRRDRREDRR